jgi:hypothetical protein
MKFDYYKRVDVNWFKEWGLQLTICFCLIFATLAWIYDLGIKQGQISALKTAYEVCRKVAPCE